MRERKGSVNLRTTNTKAVYQGGYTVLNANGLREQALGNDTTLCQDLRPFQTVIRYLGHLGYQPASSEGAGTPLVVYRKHGQVRTRNISMQRMVHICLDRCMEEQSKACGFPRMCAEEDEEELRLILDLLHNRGAHQTPTFEQGKSHAQTGADEDVKPSVIDMTDEDDWQREQLLRVLPGKARKDVDSTPPHMMF